MYTFDGTLNIFQKHDVTYDGRYEFEAGFAIGGSSNITLTGVRVTAVGGDGVTFGEGVPPNHDIIVRGSSFNCIGRQGITIGASAVNIAVEDCRFDQIARSVLDAEMVNPTEVADTIVFTNNTVGLFGNALVAAEGVGVQKNVTVSDNVLTVKPLSFKYGSPDQHVDRYNFTFSGNISQVDMSGRFTIGMSLSGVQGALFEDNVQHFIGKPPIPYNKAAVGLNWDTSDVMFIGNDFTGAMSLWGSQDGSATTVIDGGENTL